jgi:hypothetical protein
MAEFEGNVLRPPGVGVTKTVAPPEELLASYNPPPLKKGGTVLAGVGILRVGEPMKPSADGKTWVKAAYADAKALNYTAVDATSENRLINLIFGGVINVKVVAITAANATALATALGGTYIPNFGYLKF